MKNAVIYARYSSDKQTEQTIENQIRICTEYANSNEMSIVGVYADQGKSGRDDNRPEFQKMLHDSKLQKFDTIIVYMLDRFMRNTYLAMTTEHQLQEYGVELISVCEPFFKDEFGISNVMKYLVSWKADEFSRTLSRRMKDAHKNVLLKGNFVGGGIPLGYKVENKKIVIDESSAEIVRYLFEQYSQGTQKQVILANVKRLYGRTIHQNSLSYFLRNRKYIGITEYAGEEYTSVHPAIVDKILFEKVQKMLKTRQAKPASGTAKEKYLLQGKIFCLDCGSPMICESGKSHTGTMHYYYACAKRKKEHACARRNVRRDLIEDKVIKITEKYVFEKKYINKYIDVLLEKYNRDYDTEHYLESLSKQLKTAEARLTKLTESYIDAPRGSLLAQKIKLETQKLEPQIFELRELINVTKNQIQSKITKKQLLEFFDDLQKNSKSSNYAEELVDLFVDKVFLDSCNDIIITYKFKPSDSANLQEIKKGSKLNLTGEPRKLKNEPFYFLTQNKIFGIELIDFNFSI